MKLMFRISWLAWNIKVADVKEIGIELQIKRAPPVHRVRELSLQAYVQVKMLSSSISMYTQYIQI
jgi:hypothetical protein